MFGTLDTRRIPTLLSYEEAAAHEAKVKPIRGRASECKPLGQRNLDNFTIRKLANGDIAVRVHSTDVLIYRPSGIIELQVGGWSTDTTHKILGAVLRWKLSAFHHQGRSWVTAIGSNGVRGNFRVPVNGPLYLSRAFDGSGFVVANPEPVVTHRVNRKAMNLVRKRYAPYLSTLKSYIALAVNDRGLVEFSGGNQTRGEYHELMLSDDPADHYEAIQLFYERGCLSGPQMLRRFDAELLAKYRDEVLEPQTAPMGKLATDRYKYLT